MAKYLDSNGVTTLWNIAKETFVGKDGVLDLLSYGVSWQPNVADPALTRVGNMSFHKTLPIQNNMRGCIAQMKDGVVIKYFLDASDWRWRESDNARANVLNSQTLTVTDGVYTLTNNVFGNLRYEYQWVKINGVACKVSSIDTSTKTATLTPDSTIEAGTYDVQMGAVLNGYDGEVMVLVPEFWIKSWDTSTQREVRISPSKIDDTWEHQPKCLVSAYHDAVINTVPENMGYLSTLPVNSAVSIANIHDYCRGGDNAVSYDTYLTTDPCRSMLGKPRTALSRSTMRTYSRNSGKEVMSYLQYKRIMYWLYVIEYANFNSQATFNSELTSEGYRQGGLGAGITEIGDWNAYSGYRPITPNGYTNEIGNGTNIKLMTANSRNNYVPRWHGIENPFGDIWNNMDGIIINAGSITEGSTQYNQVFVTDDPTLYSDSDYSKMKLAGLHPYTNGYIKEWDLGDTAEIIPRLVGGNTTQYKCDYLWGANGTGLKTLFFGGDAVGGTAAGLGCFSSHSGVAYSPVGVGFRAVCVVNS